MKACCASSAPAFSSCAHANPAKSAALPPLPLVPTTLPIPSSLAPGGDYSTKFSAWLAHGCLSPRTVYHEIKRYERQTGTANKSTYWVIFEVIWRDFFRCVSGLSLKQGAVGPVARKCVSEECGLLKLPQLCMASIKPCFELHFTWHAALCAGSLD
jgi:hypothetical protein